jgi:chromatin segregation and condensation protein Rec8/ScpA/Scc1 (kleisin family)
MAGKQDGFKRYSRIMKLFDQLIVAVERTDGGVLSPQQLHDMAYYYEEHLRESLSRLGAKRLPPSRPVPPAKKERDPNWKPRVLTREEARALLEEGRKCREELEKRIAKMQEISIEERFTKAR